MKGDHRSYIRNFCSCEKNAFFSGFLFATANVAYITAMIILHLIIIVIDCLLQANDVNERVWSIA